MKNTKNSIELEVLKPFTGNSITSKNAYRLDTLNGKTICEIAGGLSWGESKTFLIIRELLQKRFPSAKFIPYTEMPQAVSTYSYTAQLDKVINAVKEKKCDAVIVGNGG